MRLVVLIALSSVLLCSLGASATVPNSSWGSQFQGKNVLVTGGSSGIGLATVLGFAREGAHVILCARDAHASWFNGTGAASSVNSDAQVKTAGGSATFFRADVSKQEDVAALFAHIAATVGSLDIAVNNAGVSGPIMGLKDIPENWIYGENDPLQANLYGTVHCMREELKMWESQGKPGIIVNTASFLGQHGCQECPLYSASKHGIIGLTQSVAMQYAAGSPIKLRVNAVLPGMVDTPMIRNSLKPALYQEQPWQGDLIRENSDVWQKYKGTLNNSLPNKLMAQPEQMASVIMFLSSDAASYINGAAYPVDSTLSDG